MKRVNPFMVDIRVNGIERPADVYVFGAALCVLVVSLMVLGWLTGEIIIDVIGLRS